MEQLTFWKELTKDEQAAVENTMLALNEFMVRSCSVDLYGISSGAWREAREALAKWIVKSK